VHFALVVDFEVVEVLLRVEVVVVDVVVDVVVVVVVVGVVVVVVVRVVVVVAGGIDLFALLAVTVAMFKYFLLQKLCAGA
jgi:hypothetical protein